MSKPSIVNDRLARANLDQLDDGTQIAIEQLARRTPLAFHSLAMCHIERASDPAEAALLAATLAAAS